MAFQKVNGVISEYLSPICHPSATHLPPIIRIFWCIFGVFWAF